MNVVFFMALTDPGETGWFARHVAMLARRPARRYNEYGSRLWSVPVEQAHFFYADVARRPADASHSAACAGWPAGHKLSEDDDISDDFHPLIAAFRLGKVVISTDCGQTWIPAPADADRPAFWQAAAALAEFKAV